MSGSMLNPKRNCYLISMGFELVAIGLKLLPKIAKTRIPEIPVNYFWLPVRQISFPVPFFNFPVLFGLFSVKTCRNCDRDWGS